ncbi:NnrU family protein [Agrobacterium tumefaciens]|uniref:NnrU family protein n=1 Tax=Agrobacterium tumefaciens TaxID=358 RepID=A0A4D7YKU8_AGRTU|nr:NnrU family protein [Agrobacterium tumefaciens]QCL94476.1 NnrU family protein [Agrobacterium tumefaciens]UXT22972.1 NnrU family protein [Agrobacterium tumefaciens]
MLFLALCLALFLLTHLLKVVAPQFRARVIASMGEGPFKGVYSLVSLITLGLVIYAFGEARQETGMVWYPPVWTSHLAVTLMLPAMICLIASLIPAGHIAVKTKHPLILSVKIWALAHLLANGETSSILLFASFLAWGVVMRISLKRRERAGEKVVRDFVSGRYDLVAIVGGIVLWGAFILKLHEWLIGVQPIVL